MALTSMVVNPSQYVDHAEIEAYQISTNIFVKLIEETLSHNILKNMFGAIDYQADILPQMPIRHHSNYFPLTIDIETAIDKARTIEKALCYNSQQFSTSFDNGKLTSNGVNYIMLAAKPINKPLVILSRLGKALRLVHDHRKDKWRIRLHGLTRSTFIDLKEEEE
jgi:hypothetical protein